MHVLHDKQKIQGKEKQEHDNKFGKFIEWWANNPEFRRKIYEKAQQIEEKTKPNFYELSDNEREEIMISAGIEAQKKQNELIKEYERKYPKK